MRSAVPGIRLLMGRTDLEFNAWPWFWLCVVIWVGASVTRPPGFTAFSVMGIFGALSALALLVIGILNAIRRRRGPK